MPLIDVKCSVFAFLNHLIEDRLTFQLFEERKPYCFTMTNRIRFGGRAQENKGKFGIEIDLSRALRVATLAEQE